MYRTAGQFIQEPWAGDSPHSSGREDPRCIFHLPASGAFFLLLLSFGFYRIDPGWLDDLHCLQGRNGKIVH